MEGAFVMEISKDNNMINNTVQLRQTFSKSSYELEEIMRIYLGTPIVDHFRNTPQYLSISGSYHNTVQKNNLHKKLVKSKIERRKHFI